MGDVYSFTNHSFMAAATPMLFATGNEEWDLRFADWMIADALARADIEFGRYFDAGYAFDNAKAALTQRFGPGFSSHHEGKALWEPVWVAIGQAEEERSKTYLEPLWEAARALMLTPAPNLAAALFKIELAKREELNNDVEMEERGDPFDIVAADMARLRVGAA